MSHKLFAMAPPEKDLWKKISGFSFDNEGNVFNFSDRLARDNGWSKDFALQVIEEYKKFLFLSAISTTGVTPSDAVDQAWHLHLTYTRSYWTDLCVNVLGKAIQHNPTQGGNKEAQKYLDYYDQTLAQYCEKFGTEPPRDIWPDSKKRFSDIDFIRVNKRANWVIQKPGIKTSHLQFGIVLVLLWAFLYMVSAGWWAFVIFTFILIILGIFSSQVNNKDGKNDNSGSGCSTGSGCSSGGDGNHGHSGGDSGCSGCSGSGCSGCGGGGD